MSRKVVCYIAMSADGFIARPDGEFDWLMRHAKSPDAYGYQQFVANIDTVIWGRTTWNQMVSTMDAAPDMGDMRSYVFTSHPETGPAKPRVEYTDEPVKSFMERLRAAPGKNIWMMGGGRVIASFLDAGELDEFIISVIPVMIGEGIPLVAPRHREVPLELLETKRHDDGVVMLHYAVGRA
ncbi:MAG TPA: dihydrofolate reductase family protein [Longimicrobiales bacterium]